MEKYDMTLIWIKRKNYQLIKKFTYSKIEFNLINSYEVFRKGI